MLTHRKCAGVAADEARGPPLHGHAAGGVYEAALAYKVAFLHRADHRAARRVQPPL